ncbi:MAG: amidohydrolase [Ruminococcaceae bacterium]|nr:amidohydrolase [Oscillospiraceae bacterium]
MIIDFHTHIFPDSLAPRAIETLAKRSALVPYTDGTAKCTLKKMDEFSVDKSVCLNIATKPTQQRKINDFMKDIMNSSYGERLIPFGTVHPDATDALDEIQYIKDSSIKGIKLHPDYQNFYADDKKMDGIYDVASQLDLPIIFHAGYDIGMGCPIHCTPLMIKKIAKRFPKLTVIAAHFGGNGMWNDALELTSELENVYYDTAFPWNLDKITAKKLISKKGADKILFASDCPWDSPKRIIDFIDSLQISSKEKELIFAENAKNLLNL